MQTETGVSVCPRCERRHPLPFLHQGDCVNCYAELAPYGRPALPHGVFCRQCVDRMQGLETLPPEEREARDPLMRHFEGGLALVRLGDSWLFLSKTDKTEPYHRVDVIDGVCYCTCRGARKAINGCRHVNRVLGEIF